MNGDPACLCVEAVQTVKGIEGWQTYLDSQRTDLRSDSTWDSAYQHVLAVSAVLGKRTMGVEDVLKQGVKAVLSPAVREDTPV